MKTIDLPDPSLKGKMSLEEAILNRRSVRDFDTKRALKLDMISQLLWAAQGITDKRNDLRSAPSAGGLYPLEVYVVTQEGLFHYLVKTHQLRSIMDGDIRKDLKDACWGQLSIYEAPSVFIITAVYDRIRPKYGDRAIRYTDNEVGHVAENLELQAVTLGLGSVSIGAFEDNKVKEILALPENEKILYIIPVGYKK